MDVARLINEVYKRNGIWDHRTSSHYIRDAVTSLWFEIAEALDAPVEAVKAKWRNLRDTYTAECRKMYKRSRGKEPLIRSKWIWFSSMDFLRPHLKRLRELQEGMPTIVGSTMIQPVRNLARMKRELKQEPECDIKDDEHSNLIENIEVDMTPNEALLQAVTQLEEDENGTVITDVDDDEINGNDHSLAMTSAFSYNNYMISSNGPINSNGSGSNRSGSGGPGSGGSRKRTWQMSTPYSLATDIDRRRARRAHLEEELSLRTGEIDDTYHFLISLREPLKSLALDRQMYVRYKIQELLFNETCDQQKHNMQAEPPEPLETTPEIISIG